MAKFLLVLSIHLEVTNKQFGASTKTQKSGCVCLEAE